ncbi:MFS transporter [Cellulomonas soli]|uniref:MFS transporter n=1 Tax=Cellulomonas soli TaxID=931535 RepID=UPI003F872CFF
MSTTVLPAGWLPGSFHRLWSAGLLGNLADGVGMVAVPLLAMRLSDDPLVVSTISALGLLPWLLLGAFSGAVVDRTDRRRAMGGGALVRGLLLATLALAGAVAHVPLWVLFVTVFAVACVETVADGAAQAMVPSLVPVDRLDTANSRYQAGELVTQGLVALPLGTALFAWSTSAPFVVGACAYAAAAVLAFTLPRRAARAAVPVQPAAPESVWRSTAQGLRYTFAAGPLRRLVLVSTALAATLQFAQGSLVFYLVRGVGLPEAALGLVTAGMAIGGVLGATVSPRMVARVGRRGAMLSAAVLAGISFALLGAVPGVLGGVVGMVAAAVLVAAAAGSAAAWNVQSATVRQRIVPGHLLGRVQGAGRTLVVGLTSMAMLAGGAVSRWDLRAPLIIGGLLSVVVALAAFRALAFVDAIPSSGGPTPLSPVEPAESSGPPAAGAGGDALAGARVHGGEMSDMSDQ